MTALIKNEWKKLLQWTFFRILLLLLIIFNGILLINQIATDKEQEQKPEISAGKEASGELSHELFLSHVEEQAESMKNTSLFQDSYFNRKSIEKTQTVYSRLYGIETEEDYPSGLKYVVDYPLTDIFLLLVATAMIFRLMLYEREAGLLALIKPTVNGRGKLISAKYLTMAAGLFLMTVLFYGTNYYIAYYGKLLGAENASIQSLDGYIASPFIISVGEYTVFFFLCKWLGIIAVSNVIFLLCVCCRNQVYTILSVVIIMATEGILKLLTEDYSWVSFLRQFNLVSVMDVSSYFKDYINFNFFGVPVSSVTAAVLTVFFSCLCSLWLSKRLFESETSVGTRANRFCRRGRLPLYFPVKISSSLFRGECRKLFFMRKGLFLLLILIVVQIVSYWESPYYMNEAESCYYQYSMSLQGKPSMEKTGIIEKEEKRFEAQAEKLEKQYVRYDKGEISYAVLQYYEKELTPSPMELAGFDKAKKQYFKVKDALSACEDVVYIYQTGWEKLLGPQCKNDEILDFMKIFLILLLAFSGMGTVERTTCAELLIQSSYRGNRSVQWIKRLLCAGYAFIASVITFAGRPAQIAEYYTLSGFEASVQSIMLFSDTDLSLSVGGFVCMIYLIKVIIAVAAGEFILALSEKCTQESTVFFLGSMILLVPAAIWFFF